MVVVLSLSPTGKKEDPSDPLRQTSDPLSYNLRHVCGLWWHARAIPLLKEVHNSHTLAVRYVLAEM